MAANDEPATLGPPVPLGGDNPCPSQPLTLADTLATALDDVRAQPASSRPFLRYVSVGQFRPGPCVDDEVGSRARRMVETARRAVSRLSNGMSRLPRAVVPEAVGPEGLLLRLDLRDYGWESARELDGQSHATAWEVLVARSALALELEGDMASELTRELGTRVPLLLSSAFVATAARADVYYAILRLPATLAELEGELGIAGDEGLERGPWARAVFSNSGVSQQPRGVARYRGSALGDGYFWRTFDFGPSARSEVLFLEPLATRADGHQVLFSLPNGLPAFYSADGDGARVLEASYLLDPGQNNGRMRVASSCGSCHNAGIITFIDEARDFIEDNTDLYPEAVLARAREAFVSQDEMALLREADSERMAEAAGLAGQPRGTPDPVSRAFLDYEQGLTFERLAAELFLDTSSLIERLPSLPEDIATAATSGALERGVFEARYLEVACAVYSRTEISPRGCP